MNGEARTQEHTEARTRPISQKSTVRVGLPVPIRVMTGKAIEVTTGCPGQPDSSRYDRLMSFDVLWRWSIHLKTNAKLHGKSRGFNND